jgi:hypothetical protein
VAVTDGGSPESFLRQIRGLSGLHLTERRDSPGLVEQVRESLRIARAWGASSILYTEPDKVSFLGEHLKTFLRTAAIAPVGGVVLAARSRAGLATFPASQQRAEGLFNELCGDLIGQCADYLYGPFLLHADLVAELDQLPAAIGWGWRPYLFVRSALAGRPLTAIEGDYACPLAQRGDEPGEAVHRLTQLRQNVDGLVAALTV